MRRLKLSSALAVVITATISPAVGYAQSTGLEDMVGARAGQAEGELQRRGYVDTGGSQGDDRTYTNWWHAGRRQCVVIATMNGRYSSIVSTPVADCHQSAAVRLRPDVDQSQVTGPRPGYQPDPAFRRPLPRPDNGGSDDPGPVVGGRPVDLGLVCFGDGSRDGIASGTTWTWNPRSDRYEYGRYNETRAQVFDASLMIQTWAGGGRIRLPRALIPPINSRGNNGWWDLYDVAVTRETIRATYRLNGLNKPRVTIDRRSGRIAVNGTSNYGFHGTCDLIGNQPRRF